MLELNVDWDSTFLEQLSASISTFSPQLSVRYHQKLCFTVLRIDSPFWQRWTTLQSLKAHEVTWCSTRRIPDYVNVTEYGPNPFPREFHRCIGGFYMFLLKTIPCFGPIPTDWVLDTGHDCHCRSFLSCAWAQDARGPETQFFWSHCGSFNWPCCQIADRICVMTQSLQCSVDMCNHIVYRKNKPWKSGVYHLIYFPLAGWNEPEWSPKNIRPWGYPDLNLQSNVHFVLAGPCELQLHICKEFDQIPFSKCLKPGFWAILFWYMHALLIIFFFFFRSVFIQRLLCATVGQ